MTKILILGLGNTGLSIIKFLLNGTYKITVLDNRKNPPKLEELNQLNSETSEFKFINQDFSRIKEDFIKEFNWILISPGIAPKEIINIKNIADKNQIKIKNDLELFIFALDDLKEKINYNPKIIAITGTNGKTTVTKLTDILLKSLNKKSLIAGNVGPALFDVLVQNFYDLPDFWVLELSSFQLNNVKNFNPSVATILNITPDHLDWHESMENYIKAKFNIFGKNTIKVLNINDKLLIKENKKNEKYKKTKDNEIINIGGDFPYNNESFNLDNNKLLYIKRYKDSNLFTSETILSINDLKIKGIHNSLNVLVSLALVNSVTNAIDEKTNKEYLIKALKKYSGEEHRLNFVRTLNGVKYFNDSKGTNVGATITAINSLGKKDKNKLNIKSRIRSKNIILILGGIGKEQDFTLLISSVKKHVKTIILIGEIKNELNNILKNENIKKIKIIVAGDDLNLAVKLAQKESIKEDIVLLSPACASFDMFKDYQERGNAFVSAVKRLRFIK